MRDGEARRLALLLAAITALALVFASCGGGEDPTEVDTAAVIEEEEDEADVETLNAVLGRQLAVVGAYDRVLPHLRGGARTLAAQFRQQEQEHIEGIIEALQGLDGAEEAEVEEIEPDSLTTEAQYLRFLYEVESETIEEELAAIGHLSAAGPRSLLASTVANQAQHLVLLRRALGAIPLEWVPAPFETGATPAP